jgi:septum site-determining protein MinD
MAMAGLGQRILIIDCDFGNRCLDIIMGLSDETLYDLGDIALGRIRPEEALIEDGRTKNIHFIAAPYDAGGGVRKSAFQKIVRDFAESGNYDYIFIDTPGGLGEPLDFAASVADTAYIIVAPTLTAIRAAERTGIFMAQKGVKRRRLIVNKFYGRSIKKAKEEVISFIDETAVKLIGVVPYDPAVIHAGNTGKLIDEILNNNVSGAFVNIAKRTMGQACPLFDGIKRLKKLR